mmetsp:Transcript_27467/g.42879  ORF Transcript_27467/g.42879 Transcript_27467/m.42879 type:complete len:159 (+) Transcript_27467:83-559(+)
MVQPSRQAGYGTSSDEESSEEETEGAKGDSQTRNPKSEAASLVPEEKFDRFVLFAGETLGRLTGGKIRAPLHYVDERILGVPRISFPFFMRARPDALIQGPPGNQLQADIRVGDFMEKVVLSQRPWVRPKTQSWRSSLTNWRSVGDNARWGIGQRSDF